MFSSFFKGVSQGCGIVFGLMVMIILMQLSAFLLKKAGVEFEDRTQKLEIEYDLDKHEKDIRRKSR